MLICFQKASLGYNRIKVSVSEDQIRSCATNYYNLRNENPGIYISAGLLRLE